MTAVRIGLTAAAVQERAQPSLHTVTHPITTCTLLLLLLLLLSHIIKQWKVKKAVAVSARIICLLHVENHLWLVKYNCHLYAANNAG
jgi:hypothetical protein